MWSGAVWKEQGREVEGVIPTKWINGGHVFGPNKNESKAMKKQTSPEKGWMKFNYMKTKFLSGKIF